MATRNRSPGCDGSEAACVGARQRSEPRWAERLPDGLYVRDGPGDDDRERAQDRPSVARVRQWSITGRNPDFGWDIVVTDLGANLGGFALHCTKYGDRDHALSLDDVLRLIRAGTHLPRYQPGRQTMTTGSPQEWPAAASPCGQSSSRRTRGRTGSPPTRPRRAAAPGWATAGV